MAATRNTTINQKLPNMVACFMSIASALSKGPWNWPWLVRWPCQWITCCDDAATPRNNQNRRGVGVDKISLMSMIKSFMFILMNSFYLGKFVVTKPQPVATNRRRIITNTYVIYSLFFYSGVVKVPLLVLGVIYFPGLLLRTHANPQRVEVLRKTWYTTVFLLITFGVLIIKYY